MECFCLFVCFIMETLQAEASLQGIQVNHKLLPKWMYRRKRTEITRKLIPQRGAKKCWAFAPADLQTRGIISEVYVCALVVQCVLWVGDRAWYCAQSRELALLCMHRKVWTSSLSFRRVSRGKDLEERVWSLLVLWSVHWSWLLAELVYLIEWVCSGVRLWV